RRSPHDGCRLTKRKALMFLGCTRKSCRYGVPNRRVFLWRDFQSDVALIGNASQGIHSVGESLELCPRENYNATIVSQKGPAGIPCYQVFRRPRQRLCTPETRKRCL